MIQSKRNNRSCVLGLIAVLGALAAPVASHAEMVQSDEAITVFETSAIVSGKQKSKSEFTIPFSGTVTITLRDLEWPERLASLSFRLADACHETLVKFKVPGTFTFELDSPGQFFAQVSARTHGHEDLGRYSLQVVLSPVTSAVPLPAGAVLLLSGLGGLAAFRVRGTRRKALAPS